MTKADTNAVTEAVADAVTGADLNAPIVAVTVYPTQARITRRVTVTLPAGEHRLRVAPLPTALHRDSLRVSGHGPATVLGVDLTAHRQPRSSDEEAVELERQHAALGDELAALDDTEAVEAQRAELLSHLAQRSGGTYARALATGDVRLSEVTVFVDFVTEQLTAGKDRRRELSRRRTELMERRALVERKLQAIPSKRQPDRLAAEVTVLVDRDDAELRLELTYRVEGARWKPSYDLRLVDETVAVTWFGLVSQHTGEDWPECDLRLSTARPSLSAAVPELSPWYLDRELPIPMMTRARVGGPSAAPAGPPPPSAAPASSGPPAAPLRESAASVEQGVTAATYRTPRAVRIPADGTAHRAIIAEFELPAALDHVTAPVSGPEAYLRATVRNASEHTLLPGPATVFHDGDLVGATSLPIWAPGEKTELALGVDDRIRVERKLVGRADTKAALSSVRRRERHYCITVSNHGPRATTVTVLDQLPVSRDEGIKVRELRLDPTPAERTELGELTWRLRLDPGKTDEITMGVRVETAPGVELAGWRE